MEVCRPVKVFQIDLLCELCDLVMKFAYEDMCDGDFVHKCPQCGKVEEVEDGKYPRYRYELISPQPRSGN